MKTKELIIQQLIQSPFWDTKHIDSIYLKNTLEHLNKSMNDTKLVYDYLYETNVRIKLYWHTYNILK